MTKNGPDAWGRASSESTTFGGSNAAFAWLVLLLTVGACVTVEPSSDDDGDDSDIAVSFDVTGADAVDEPIDTGRDRELDTTSDPGVLADADVDEAASDAGTDVSSDPSTDPVEDADAGSDLDVDAGPDADVGVDLVADVEDTGSLDASDVNPGDQGDGGTPGPFLVRFTPTAAAGQVSSSDWSATLYVGTPQPHGAAGSPGYDLVLGPMARPRTPGGE